MQTFHPGFHFIVVLLTDHKLHPVAFKRAEVLVIGLGCENNQVDAFRDTLGAFESDRVEFMVCHR
jgi:altronate dehydratase